MTSLTPMGKVTFRIIENDDQDFLMQVYKNSRADEMAHASMSQGDIDHFLEGQFRMQSESFALNFIGAVHRIIQLDGVDIGRLIILRSDEFLRVIDISILSAFRGRGIGTDIMKSLLNEAFGGDVPVRLAVIDGNPTVNFYLRLGFFTVEMRGKHLELEWRHSRNSLTKRG